MRLLLVVAILSLLSGLGGVACAQSTSTYGYQGYLTDVGAPATGSYDFLTAVYQTPTGAVPAPVSSMFHDNVAVAAGLFTLNLPAPPIDVIDGSVLPYLDICVRPGASTGTFVCLPRTPMTAVPRAFSADTALFAHASLAWTSNGAGTVHNATGRIGVNALAPIATIEGIGASASEYVIARFAGSNPGGTWLDLVNSGGGGTWNMISTGTGNGEGANSLVFRGGAPAGSRMVIDPNGHLTLNGGGTRLGTQSMMTIYRNQGGFNLIDLANADGDAFTGFAIGDGAIRTLFGYDGSQDEFSIRVGGAGFTERLVIEESNGRVGIGTDAPGAMLHVTESALSGFSPPATAPVLALERNGESFLDIRSSTATQVQGSAALRLQAPGRIPAALQFNSTQNPSGVSIRTGTDAVNDDFVVTVDGRVGVGRVPNDTTGNAFEVTGNASKSSPGDWLSNSDARIKTQVRDIRDALATLRALHPVTYRYSDAYLGAHPDLADVSYYNVIAQEFAQVFPDAVKSSGEYLPGLAKSADSEILQVDTHPMQITAIAALQELDVIVAAQTSTIAAQQAEIAKLQARLARIEAQFGADR